MPSEQVLKGKTVVITGANDGIGLETARALAIAGAQIILVCRNEQKATAAIRELEQSTQSKLFHFVQADLMRQQSIRDAAILILNISDTIDVLVNNAGATFSKFELTKDGLEKTIATNHFAYFLLTGLLLEAIQKSTYARIINVASDAHRNGKMDFESFKTDKKYFIFKAYAQSKLANILFTNALATKLRNSHITVNSVHPGMVKTNIGNKPSMVGFHSFMWSVVSKLFGMSNADGARSSIYLALSEDAKGVSGKYFVSNSRRNKPIPTRAVEPLEIANDPALQDQLWAISEKYCGFKYKL